MKKSSKASKHNLSPEERKLTPDNIAALVRLKKMNATLEQMHNFTGWSVSLCSKYTKDVKAEFASPLGNGTDTLPTAQQSSLAQHTAESQPPTPNETQPEHKPPPPSPDTRMIPRVSYEILTPRPVIVETNDPENNGREDHATTSLVNSNDPLERLFAYAAISSGYRNTREYIEMEILPDIKTLSIIKAAIPHTNRDTLESNFLITVEDALSFRRLTRKAREDVRRDLGEKNNGNSD
jgi:hypothetical protein